MPARSVTSRRAFTLVELMIVVVLMSIIAVSVLPAMQNLRTMREGAARDDIARMLEVTKARAMATGRPTGLRVSLADSTLTLVELGAGDRLSDVIDPLTQSVRSLVVPSTYPDVTLSSMTNGDGVSGPGTIWFDYEATPHTRTPNGIFNAYNNQFAQIELSSGQLVRVCPHTGVVELP